ncbi:hypothetical protein IAU60_005299 [Kwoniella sp. DSM 27419]
MAHVTSQTSADGKPVNTEEFWAKTSLPKYALLVCTTAALAFQVWEVVSRKADLQHSTEFASLVTQGAANVYLVLTGLSYLLTDDLRLHKSLTYHLCAVLSLLAVHHYFRTCGRYLWNHQAAPIPWISYALLGITLWEWLIVVVIPTQPIMLVDISQIYTRAVAQSMKLEDQSPLIELSKETTSSIADRFFFGFALPVIRSISQTRKIDIQDLPTMLAKYRSQNIYREVMPKYGGEAIRWPNRMALSLAYTLWWQHRWSMVKLVLVTLIQVPMLYIPHLCLQRILKILDDPRSSRWSAVAFASLLLSTKLGANVVQLQSQRFKVLSRSVFAISSDATKDNPAQTKAHILNLISSDAMAVKSVGISLLSLLTGLCEMVLGCTYVWMLLGPSGIWGLSTLLLTCPPSYFLTKLQYKLFRDGRAILDERIGLMQEMVQVITSIKMMATERLWFKRISDVQRRELRKAAQGQLLASVAGCLYSTSPIIIIIVAFAHYTLVMGKPLTAAVAFTSIAVFDDLRPTLLDLPSSIARVLQDSLGVRRIASFLTTPDVEYISEVVTTETRSHRPQEPLHVKGTVAWYETRLSTAQVNRSEQSGHLQSTFQLQELDIVFQRGELSLVAGGFGSGKTLLLLALLGEAHLVSGSITYTVSPLVNPSSLSTVDWSLLPESVAYVPQTPWLLSQSIRLLEDSDLTEIGERGKILSGGQKARVSLARAVYSRAATLLLDDVISAVDAETSYHIVAHCLGSPLLAGRTIIIASHAVEALAPLANRAIYLDDGRCTWQGTGAELLSSELMLHLRTSSSGTLATIDSESDRNKDEITSSMTSCKTHKDRPVAEEGAEASPIDTFEIRQSPLKAPRQLLKDETRATSHVGFQHWKHLLLANGNSLYWFLVIALLLVCVISPVIQGSILSMWTGSPKTHSPIFWVGLHATASLSLAIISQMTTYIRYWGRITAQRTIHSQMLESVLKAKMSFYTKSRAGSIIQRFSSDLGRCVACSEQFSGLYATLAVVAVSLVMISINGGWIFCVVFALMMAVLWTPVQWYTVASREVMRMISVIPGPINAIYSETVAGSTVIRAFGMQALFLDDLMRWQNMETTAMFWRLNITRWFTYHMELVNVLILATTLTLLLLRPETTGSTAGFALSFAGAISTDMKWLFTQLRNIELNGVSLERISEFRMLEREEGQSLQCDDTRRARWDTADDLSDLPTGDGLEDWPVAGRLSVTNLCARYGPDMPEILHEISFQVDGGQRVGIVGATGGGKSTLAKAFFSFVDVTQGHIEIDGIDISTLPLGKVRSRLGIIAQDPVLLSGSLRLNLDMEGKYSDEQLYDALRQVQLLKRTTSGVQASDNVEYQIQSVFSNLDFEVKTGGDNNSLSTGQKQLVALAQALLRRKRVMIMDEATASIDSATDAEISRVVHEEFTGTTVLIIAHRLRTIMPCSKLLVMDKGYLVQQGVPSDLIRQDGKFKDLCMASGIDEYEHLVALADEYAAGYSVPVGQLI